MTGEARAAVAGLLREQAGWCRRLGSPLYAALLEPAAEDVVAGGPTWDVLAGHEGDPHGSALALRLLGAVHRLALDGRAPALARHYPTAGAKAGAAGAWERFRDVLSERRDEVRALVLRPVQTNEVGRSAALLGGFLTVAAGTGLPLRLLEIGASAGLNLRWDHFRYQSTGWAWGDEASPVCMEDVFADACPPAAGSVRVVARLGCDRAPVDPTTDDGALTLRSYVWPDQAHRHALLRGAIEVARRVPVVVERAEAPGWLAQRLAEHDESVATVVYHSIVWQYLTSDERHAMRACIVETGRGASRTEPLAWLRLEPAGRQGPFVVRMTTWPGGEDRALAVASPHGTPVRWGAGLT